MRNTVLLYLLLPFFSVLSFATSAAQSAISEPIPIAVKSVSVQPIKTNLNTADVPTLQRELNGIGQAKAQAIVAYREANGPFQSVDELLEIKGIGNALMERNRDRLTLE